MTDPVGADGTPPTRHPSASTPECDVCDEAADVEVYFGLDAGTELQVYHPAAPFSRVCWDHLGMIISASANDTEHRPKSFNPGRWVVVEMTTPVTDEE